jgi:hypothetical protein
VTALKVGDVVDWADVPDGALVRDAQGWHAIRMRGRGVYVGQPGEEWLPANPWSDDGRWHWTRVEDAQATIIAINRTGQETADDLRRLAEVFEVREVLSRHRLPARVVVHGQTVMIDRWMYDHADAGGDFLGTVAVCLHVNGWRAGMTAEDAARLLAEAGR